jgi:predicted naringenin-chalcone synthase
MPQWNNVTKTARIQSVGTAVPAKAYSQAEIANLFGIRSAKAWAFFTHPHIEKRHFSSEVSSVPENTAKLRRRFQQESVDLSAEAVTECLLKAGKQASQVSMLCCVTSTGFMVPSLSVALGQRLGLRQNCQRLDVVGMGCNAGLNGLSAVSHWCQSNPGQSALLVCCEISSAIYSFDESEETAIVNSLFGDGAAAALISADGEDYPQVFDFASFLIPRTEECLRFEWDQADSRFRFVVEKRTPYALATGIDIPVKELLSRFALRIEDVPHWILHSGGEAILAAAEKKLGLSPHQLRHTRSVLKNFGNLSSGSFLFSYRHLLEEKNFRPGEWMVFITMGPGLSVEAALLRLGEKT